jgi:hypothetical protein
MVGTDRYIANYAGKINTTAMNLKNVVFMSRGTDVGDTFGNSFATNDIDGDGIFDGVCEICHTQTDYHRNTSAGNHSHNVGGTCVSCHPHDKSFAGGSCSSCHASEQPSGTPTRRVVIGASGDLGSTAAMNGGHLNGVSVDDTTCEVCHDQTDHKALDDPYVLLYNTDTGGTISFYGNAIELSPFCISCHDTDGATNEGANANKPFTGSGDTNSPSDVGAGHPSTECMECHGNAGASGGTLDPSMNAHGGTMGNMVINTSIANSPSYCYQCHDINGTGVTNENSKIQKYVMNSTDGGVAVFYHPIHYVGTYQADSNYGDNLMADGWALDSMVTCYDCHEFTAPAAGPHAGTGQASLMLKGFDTSVTTDGGTFSHASPGSNALIMKNLCVNCHNAAAYTWGVKDDKGMNALNNYEEIYGSTNDEEPLRGAGTTNGYSRNRHYQAGGWSGGNCGIAGSGSTSDIGCNDCHGGAEWRGGTHGISNQPADRGGVELFNIDDGPMSRMVAGNSWEGVQSTGDCYLADGTNDNYTNCGNSGPNHQIGPTINWGAWP